MKKLLRQLQREILTGEMKCFYVFLNSVAAKQCCWYGWSKWGQSSTCGQVCKLRQRNLCVVDITTVMVSDVTFN